MNELTCSQKTLLIITDEILKQRGILVPKQIASLSSKLIYLQTSRILGLFVLKSYQEIEMFHPKYWLREVQG